MPHFRLETNVGKERIPKDFMKELSTLLAKRFNKPEAYICVTVIPDSPMIWGGSDDACAFGRLMSIGKLSPNDNIKHSEALFKKICGDLEIEESRMYIVFSNEKNENVGHNGTTFFELFGEEK